MQAMRVAVFMSSAAVHKIFLHRPLSTRLLYNSAVAGHLSLIWLHDLQNVGEVRGRQQCHLTQVSKKSSALQLQPSVPRFVRITAHCTPQKSSQSLHQQPRQDYCAAEERNCQQR